MVKTTAKRIGIRGFLTRSIFGQLMAAFLLLLLPLCIMTLYFFRWSEDTIAKQSIANVMTQSNNYMDRLETEIDRIRSLQYDLVNDRTLIELVNFPEDMSDYTRIDSYLKVLNRLQGLKNSSKYIDDITCYVEHSKRSISSNDGLGSFQSIAPLNFKNRRLPWYQQLEYSDDNLYLSLYKATDITENATLSYSIVIRFSKASLIHDLQYVNPIKDSGALLTKTDESQVFNLYDKSIESLVPGIIAQSSGIGEGYRAIDIDKAHYLITKRTSGVLGLTLIGCISESALLKDADSFRTFFLIYGLSLLILIFVFSYIAFRMVNVPVMKLKNAFAQLKEGKTKYLIEGIRKDEFGQLFQGFNDMTETLDTLILQVYEQRIRAQTAELKQLQSQITPHFLYNSFFCISSLIRLEDYGTAEFLTIQLAKYYQFITHNASDEIAMKAEVEHAKTYATIQSVRWDGRIETRFDEIPKDVADIQVPRLILQPLLENAFEHAFDKRAEAGLIHVGYRRDDGFAVIEVEDNGRNVDEVAIQDLFARIAKPSDDSTALFNINSRIRLKFGEGSGLHFSIGQYGGLHVELRIEVRKHV